ncbi:MAG: Smr/MutS family protein [Bacteroidota bacterium]
MLFAVGTKVRLIHTGDVGEVVELLDNDMLQVLLDDDDTIPVSIDNLERVEATTSVKAKIVKGKQPKVQKAPERPPIYSQYAILKSNGIQLAFDPVLKPDASAEKYIVYLLNDTKQDVLYRLSCSLGGVLHSDFNGKLDAVSAQEVGVMAFDHLNESPSFDLQCWLITTTGTGSKMHKTVKVKPKQFFKSVKTAPILNKQVHLFRVFEKLVGLHQPAKEEDLRTYTKRNAAPVSWKKGMFGQLPHEVRELAEFNPEIDLHIEKLRPDHAGLNNAEILRTQLAAFESYLAKAIRLGVERVFIIHGVGEGKLKNAIATRLLRNPEVITFKNEYHPRYGYGATEVVL